MKKYVLYIIVSLAAVSLGLILSGCRQSDTSDIADSDLELAVAKIDLPRNLGDNSVLTECRYSDKTLTYRIEVDKEHLATMKVEERQSRTLENLKSSLLSQALKDKLIDAQASVKYVFFNENDSVSFILSSAELQPEEMKEQ